MQCCRNRNVSIKQLFLRASKGTMGWFHYFLLNVQFDCQYSLFFIIPTYQVAIFPHFNLPRGIKQFCVSFLRVDAPLIVRETDYGSVYEKLVKARHLILHLLFWSLFFNILSNPIRRPFYLYQASSIKIWEQTQRKRVAEDLLP